MNRTRKRSTRSRGTYRILEARRDPRGDGDLPVGLFWGGLFSAALWTLAFFAWKALA